MREDLIFALDIGTRTVMGIVGYEENDEFNVLACETIEHKSRAMMDGQIHDIEEVVQVAGKVRDNLEKRLDIKLQSVAIAAAGRSLITKQVKVERSTDPTREVTTDVVCSLEMEGIQLAQAQMDDELDEDVLYYCVGYTVISYYLNNYVISSLTGHKGKSIGADIIATFLPHTVVDSLYSVMNRIGLEVISLTLEPIAAINVAIPKELRMLNLAMVDIGAGTSDIAITKGGSIVAYGMVPMAGDEITETLCHNYLLDFNTAERVKIALGQCKGSIEFEDIIGMQHTVSCDELREVIYPGVKNLADTISRKITEFNQKSPNAVFLVGGGSQVTGLAGLVAQNLGLPEERVAVRNSNALKGIIIKNLENHGPDTITPLGIAITALQQKNQDFLSVKVNGKKIRLFNTRRQLVADALLILGIKPQELIGKRGQDLVFTINGEQKIVKGEYGEPAQIYVNGTLGNLQTPLNPGNDIQIKPAKSGTQPRISIGEIIQYYEDKVLVLVNGIITNEDYIIRDGDIIDIKDAAIEEKEEIVEEKAQEFEIPDESQMEAAKTLESEPRIYVRVNGDIIGIKDEGKKMIFVDIFNFIDFDLAKAKGSIVLKLNGLKAAFTDEIKDGDVIDIYWEK